MTNLCYFILQIGDYVTLRTKVIMINVAVRIAGRIVMLYAWDPTLALQFDRVDENNLFLVAMVRMSRLMIRIIEKRHLRGNIFRPIINPLVARPAEEGEADIQPEDQPQLVADRQPMPPQLQVQPAQEPAQPARQRQVEPAQGPVQPARPEQLVHAPVIAPARAAEQPGPHAPDRRQPRRVRRQPAVDPANILPGRLRARRP